ncbi:unnamed protein product [Acidocella sp. C78]|nr:unnamed protein product [Acidocella sp. C78]
MEHFCISAEFAKMSALSVSDLIEIINLVNHIILKSERRTQSSHI